MKIEARLNIIISGVGGQGVNALSEVLATLCARHGMKYQGATFKGGAQRAGSIHSEIKIFGSDKSDAEYYSNQIRKGTLDLIIGLEPYECLRYHEFFHRNTKIIVNNVKTSLYIERYKNSKFQDPLTELKKLCDEIIALDFTQQALEKYNDIRMLNYLMLMKALQAGYLPFTDEITSDEFLSMIKKRS